MKRLGSITAMGICIIFILTGCGLNKEQQRALEVAQIAYDEEQKALEAAQIAYDEEQRAFEVAKVAYGELCAAADLTRPVMSSVYSAWSFGIHNASNSTTSNILTNLARETNLTAGELQAGVKSLAESMGSAESTILSTMTSASRDISNWQWCLFVLEEAYVVNGTFDTIQEHIDAANAALRAMTADYDDYKHFPNLKDFYSLVLSYAEFAQSPTGSFNQLVDTKNDYENSIRRLRNDLGFVFD